MQKPLSLLRRGLFYLPVIAVKANLNQAIFFDLHINMTGICEKKSV